MTAVAEMLARFEPTVGKPDRAIGRLPDESFALFDLPPSGVARQVGPAVKFEEGVSLATAVLDGDSRALTHPNAIRKIALALVGAAWSGASSRDRLPPGVTLGAALEKAAEPVRHEVRAAIARAKDIWPVEDGQELRAVWTIVPVTQRPAMTQAAYAAAGARHAV